MQEDDFIVSKTTPEGIITYCNQEFIKISGFTEEELIGKPHNLIRHTEMPKAVFRKMWQTLGNEGEFFGYIKNRCKNGDYYWTFAHVTPSIDDKGKLLGYYSVRRAPNRAGIKLMKHQYRLMVEKESQERNKNQAIEGSLKILDQFLQSQGKTYNEFIFSLVQ